MEARDMLLRRIDIYLNEVPRPTCDVETVGPFTLFLRRGTLMPEMSYARPTGPLTGDMREEIAGVRTVFQSQGRVCRWEFIAETAPELSALLVQNGFPEPIPRPLMVVTRDTFRPEYSSFAEVRPVTKAEAREVGRVLGIAFGMPETEQGDAEKNEAEEDDFLTAAIDRGTCVIGVFVDGRTVAGGSHSPVGDTTEVAGVGTHPAFQKRGIAGALTSALVADAFARGCECVFLSAADETVQRVYARLGFEKIGMAMDTLDTP